MNRLSHYGRKELENPIAEALRRMSNEPRCEDCGTDLADDDPYDGVCADCHKKIDMDDYCPERPR